MSWIQDQTILQLNSSHTTSQILTTTCINVTDNWGFIAKMEAADSSATS